MMDRCIMYVIGFIYLIVLCIMDSMMMMYLYFYVYSFSLSYPVTCTVDDCAFLILFAKRHSEQMYNYGHWTFHYSFMWMW